MERRLFTMILVVIVGIVVGVGIVSKQAKEPLLRQLIQSQNQMLAWQSEMKDKCMAGGAGLGSATDSQVALIVQTQRSLESRIAALEMKLTQLPQGGPSAANPPMPGPPQEDFSKVHNIPVAHSLVKGNTNAPVTIVEFVDFQCPFCARFHVPVNEVLKAYPKDVKLIVKNYPLNFHPEARPAAKVAFAAGLQGKYWEMVDALLENGQALGEAKYTELAQQLGLNVERFTKDLKEKDAQWENYIQADIDLGNQIEVRGTPTYFLNGRKTNARDLNSFKNEIDPILNQ